MIFWGSLLVFGVHFTSIRLDFSLDLSSSIMKFYLFIFFIYLLIFFIYYNFMVAWTVKSCLTPFESKIQGGRKWLPKFKFSAKFPLCLHVILQIQIKKIENDCYIMWKIILTENPSRFNVEPLLKWILFENCTVIRIEALHVTNYTVNMADCSSPFKRSVITTYHHSLFTV